MKRLSKLFCVLMVALMLVMPFNVNAAKTTKKTTTTKTTTTEITTFAKSQDEGAINVYVFYWSACSHCKELHEYLAELKEDKDIKDKFNVVDYEVTNSDNNELMQEVIEYFNANVKGVPFYVIGDQYFNGFGESSKATLVSAIEDAYTSKNYQDVVAAVVSGDVDSLYDDKSSDIVGMVVLGICVVIIIALIVCSSKNKYYDEEEVEEQPKEVVKKSAPKKAAPKKTASKASSSKTTTTKSKTSTSKNTKATKTNKK
ncbi:MAG: hypothetical protein J1F35_04305 [Erysipelotrichales bacterium]|nr:hypothetical protein [Erysipelotrichales bacterium]